MEVREIIRCFRIRCAARFADFRQYLGVNDLIEPAAPFAKKVAEQPRYRQPEQTSWPQLS